MQTLKEAGYRFIRFDEPGMAIFQDLSGTRQFERFAANKGHASWGLRWRGTDWEFCSSDVPENAYHSRGTAKGKTHGYP